MKRVLIIGCGDVAKRAIPWLGKRFKVYALVRRADAAADVRALGACPLLGDLDLPSSIRRLTGIAHAVLHFAPPAAEGESDRRTATLLTVLAGCASLPQRLVYISTTGVYGDCGGAMVDETHTCHPTTLRARRRMDAERRLRRFGVHHRGTRVSILRAPGIYAASRLPVDRLRRGDPILSPEDDVYTNHIHADDLARAVCAALFRGSPGRVYNVVDHSVMKMGEYFSLVADSFGLPRPVSVSRDELEKKISSVRWSFMSESRRLSNLRMCKELRMKLSYPSVHDGLAAARIAISGTNGC